MRSAQTELVPAAARIPTNRESSDAAVSQHFALLMPHFGRVENRSAARVQLNGQLSEHCRKKAALCLARIFRKLPPEANVISPEEWCPHFRALIGNPFSPGPQLAIMGLVTTVLERSTEGYEELQGLIVQALAATVTGRGVRKDYLYYGIPCPWLQCKCGPSLRARCSATGCTWRCPAP